MENFLREPVSEVFFGDNMEYMARFGDKFFTVAVNDPPYGIGAEQGTNRASRKQFADEEVGEWDSSIPDLAYFNEVKRISDEQVYWGGNYFQDILGACRCYHIWDKKNPDRCFADCEMAWTSFDAVARILDLKGKRVQELNKLDGGKIHPTQKPVILYYKQYQEILKILKKKPEEIKILDTHLGSGSSRIAAYILGIDFYACERKERFYVSQEERFAKFLEDKKLFLPSKKIEKTSSLFSEDDNLLTF